MTFLTIENFYKNNNLDECFDEVFYQEQFPETKDFYQPYCKENKIGDKHRLYYHYVIHGCEGLKNENEKLIILKPIQGLCNRLLQIDSAYAFAKENNFSQIKICWSKTKGFSDEKFEELFDKKALDNIFIKFISELEYIKLYEKYTSLDEHFYQNEDLQYVWEEGFENACETYKNSSFCLNHFASLDWIFGIKLESRYEFIKKLVPSKALEKEIDKYEINSNYVGLHIRAGDALNSPWSEYYKKTKEEYYDFIIQSYDKVFLSTDSKTKQEYYLKKYPNKIKFSNKNFEKEDLKETDYKRYQAEAVIDLFLLSKTREIYGTNWSTFNKVASIIGQNNIIELKKENMDFYKKNKEPYEFSAITAVKNRFATIKSSIQSWLLQESIKEIIIIDYDSENLDSSYLESIDPRIKVFQIKNKPNFNLSDAYNIAIEKASYSNIIKLDVDYFINPYFKLEDWIKIDLDKAFLTGDWKNKKLDNDLGFLEYLNGFIVVKKDYLNKVQGYRGNKFGYGYDDTDLYERLKNLNLKNFKLEFFKNNIPIFHIPHGNYHRSEYYKEKNIKKSLFKNMSKSKFLKTT